MYIILALINLNLINLLYITLLFMLQYAVKECIRRKKTASNTYFHKQLPYPSKNLRRPKPSEIFAVYLAIIVPVCASTATATLCVSPKISPQMRINHAGRASRSVRARFFASIT